MSTFGLVLNEKRPDASLRLAWLVVGIAIVNQLAMKFYWYSAIWWFDMPMHFLGGIFLGFLALWFCSFLFPRVFSQVSLATGASVVLAFVLFVGGLWEGFEFLVDHYTVLRGFNFLDTISDLCFDVAGGTAVLVYLIFNKDFN